MLQINKINIEQKLLLLRKVGMFFILLILLISHGCKSEKHIDIVPKGFNTSIVKIDTAFNKLLEIQISENLKTNNCPGVAVLVVQENQIIFENQYGIKSINSNDQIDEETVFRLGSVSKGFAGILAAILIDKKLFSLNDPICKYVPELTLKAKSLDDTLRVKHILTHSTGLTEHAFSNLVDQNKDFEIIIKNLNRLTPRDSTGKSYAYQNAAFGLIEKVITKTTGMTYPEALDYFIFSPLEMCNSSSTYEEIIHSKNVSHGHKPSGKSSFKQIDFSPHYYNVASAGGINASLIDMKKWLCALMGFNPEVINKNVRDLAFTPYISTISDDKYFNRWPGIVHTDYGLGWRIINTDDNKLIYHGGLVNGFRAEIAFDPNKKLGIVMLFNSTCTYSNEAVQLFYRLWNDNHNLCI